MNAVVGRANVNLLLLLRTSGDYYRNYENQNRLCLCRPQVKLACMRHRINYTLLAVSTLRDVKSRSCFRQNLLRLDDVRRLQNFATTP